MNSLHHVPPQHPFQKQRLCRQATSEEEKKKSNFLFYSSLLLFVLLLCLWEIQLNFRCTVSLIFSYLHITPACNSSQSRIKRGYKLKKKRGHLFSDMVKKAYFRSGSAAIYSRPAVFVCRLQVRPSCLLECERPCENVGVCLHVRILSRRWKMWQCDWITSGWARCRRRRGDERAAAARRSFHLAAMSSHATHSEFNTQLRVSCSSSCIGWVVEEPPLICDWPFKPTRQNSLTLKRKKKRCIWAGSDWCRRALSRSEDTAVHR